MSVYMVVCSEVARSYWQKANLEEELNHSYYSESHIFNQTEIPLLHFSSNLLSSQRINVKSLLFSPSLLCCSFSKPAVQYVCAQSLQSGPILCNLMDCNTPGSSVHGIVQARILEWVAMHCSRGSSNPGMEPKSSTSPALQVDSLWSDNKEAPKPAVCPVLSCLVVSDSLQPHEL